MTTSNYCTGQAELKYPSGSEIVQHGRHLVLSFCGLLGAASLAKYLHGINKVGHCDRKCQKLIVFNINYTPNRASVYLYISSMQYRQSNSYSTLSSCILQLLSPQQP